MEVEATQALDISYNDDSSEEQQDKKLVGYLKVIHHRTFPHTSFPVYEKLNIIGRQPDKCDICIPVKSLSKEHACIEVKNGTHLIYDLDSRNKTRRNKLYLTPQIRYELNNSDSLTIADVECVYNKVSINSDRKLFDETNCDSETESEAGSESLLTQDEFILNNNKNPEISTNVQERNSKTMMETMTCVEDSMLSEDNEANTEQSHPIKPATDMRHSNTFRPSATLSTSRVEFAAEFDDDMFDSESSTNVSPQPGVRQTPAATQRLTADATDIFMQSTQVYPQHVVNRQSESATQILGGGVKDISMQSTQVYPQSDVNKQSTLSTQILTGGVKDVPTQSANHDISAHLAAPTQKLAYGTADVFMHSTQVSSQLNSSGHYSTQVLGDTVKYISMQSTQAYPESARNLTDLPTQTLAEIPTQTFIERQNGKIPFSDIEHTVGSGITQAYDISVVEDTQDDSVIVVKPRGGASNYKDTGVTQPYDISVVEETQDEEIMAGRCTIQPAGSKIDEDIERLQDCPTQAYEPQWTTDDQPLTSSINDKDLLQTQTFFSSRSDTVTTTGDHDRLKNTAKPAIEVSSGAKYTTTATLPISECKTAVDEEEEDSEQYSEELPNVH